MTSLRRYMDLLEDVVPEEHSKRALFLKRKNRAFAELMQIIAKQLGRQIDKNDLLEGGYYPQGLVDEEKLHLENRLALNAVLSGASPLFVTNQTFKPNTQATDPDSKYPAPPQN